MCTLFSVPLDKIKFNLFPTIHNNCRLLSLLLMYFGDLYYKQYGPYSNYLIRVPSVCCHDKISLGGLEYIQQPKSKFFLKKILGE